MTGRNGELGASESMLVRIVSRPVFRKKPGLSRISFCRICIILSGTGTDGTLGVKAIKGELGMVMFLVSEAASFVSGQVIRVDGAATIDMFKLDLD